MSIKVDPDWWKTLFDDVYLLTDARSVCNNKITCCEVDVFCNMIPMKKKHQILDLCGGHGRHTIELYSRGYKNCTMLDYSDKLLNHARQNADQRGYCIEFVQGDAGKTKFADNAFDHVLLLGNSFGYIKEQEADRQILKEAYRILCPDGWILLDVSNGLHIKDRFNPNAWHEINSDVVVCRQRELHDNIISTREMVISKQKGLIRDQTYCIRIYEPDTLASMAEDSGFINSKIHSKFSPHGAKGDFGFMNNRMILTAQKP